MQRYVANVAITQSVFRPFKGVRVAREFLGCLDLNLLKPRDPSAYPEWLDSQTQALVEILESPIKDFWGRARKSINIFMTMASLNRFLCREYGLERFEHMLEVPLDSIVEKKLSKFGCERTGQIFGQGREFPKWNGIKGLDKTNSDKYQQIAKTMAEKLGIPRGRLDVELWEPPNENITKQ